MLAEALTQMLDPALQEDDVEDRPEEVGHSRANHVLGRDTRTGLVAIALRSDVRILEEHVVPRALDFLHPRPAWLLSESLDQQICSRSRSYVLKGDLGLANRMSCERVHSVRY